jgi:hypothetical protein
MRRVERDQIVELEIKHRSRRQSVEPSLHVKIVGDADHLLQKGSQRPWKTAVEAERVAHSQDSPKIGTVELCFTEDQNARAGSFGFPRGHGGFTAIFIGLPAPPSEQSSVIGISGQMFQSQLLPRVTIGP